MVLEDKPDRVVAERCGVLLSQLEGIASIQRNGPRSRMFQRAEDVEQRALTRSRRTHYCHGVATLQRKTNAGEHRKRPAWCRIFLRDIRHFKHRHAPPQFGSKPPAHARPCERRCSARELRLPPGGRVPPPPRGL